jgi:hypothetical protein
MSTRIVSNLIPLSEYVWKIKTICDSTSSSSWSVNDTFSTVTFNCPNTNSTNTTNINYNNALASWDTVQGSNRYKIRYRMLGTTSWSDLGAVYHPLNIRVIPVLDPTTTYEWQIKTYHDSTILLGSLWSASDTFTTASFVAAPFNPIINNTLSTLECGKPAELYIEITQAADEPDVGSGSITTDGGYFNIGSINIGDSVGYASMITSNQSISTVLRAGVILGQDYAIINSFDTSGSLIGFFTIENENGGVKVEIPGSPNDGNNYTSGYVSEIYFTDLFVNPENAGPLSFFTDITSELSDQVYSNHNALIWCNPTEIIESKDSKYILNYFDVLGRINQKKENTIHIVKLSSGTIEKRIMIQE